MKDHKNGNVLVPKLMESVKQFKSYEHLDFQNLVAILIICKYKNNAVLNSI